MLRHRSGTEARSGFYWSLSRWTIVTMPKGGGVLPAGEARGYVKLPVLLLLALAPLMGGLYVMFLPCVGFAMVFSVAGRKAVEVAGRAVTSMLATVSPAWLPGEAHFAGKGTPRSTRERAGSETTEAEPAEAEPKAETH